MGRVRRYKKFKACDPFSKQSRSTVSADDANHDEPPTIFHDAVRKADKRRLMKFQDEDRLERELQREALRSIEENEAKGNPNKKKLEGRKEDETMKQFKRRIRQDTRTALRDELKNLTSTSKKNKEYLKTKRYKKKGIDRYDINDELIEEGFSSRDDGVLRKSDIGGEESFPQAEILKFGDRMDRPPDFRGLDAIKRKNEDTGKKENLPMIKAKMNMKGELLQNKQKQQQQIQIKKNKLEKEKKLKKKEASDQFYKKNKNGTNNDDNDNEDEYDEEENVKPKKSNKRKRNICDIVTSEGGSASTSTDGFSLTSMGRKMKDGVLVKAKKQKGNDNDTNAKKRNTEDMRRQAQEAYRTLRDKKRTF